MHDLNSEIKAWLASADTSDRHIIAGAELFLRVSKNRIFYNNIIRSPQKFAPRLIYELRKVIEAREAAASIEEAKKKLRLIKPKVDKISEKISRSKSVFQNGKRADHDLLPEEIRQLWVDNGNIRLKMRDTHTRMQIAAEHKAECNTPDLLLLATELVRLDKLYHENWYTYDHYIRADETLCSDNGCVRR